MKRGLSVLLFGLLLTGFAFASGAQPEMEVKAELRFASGLLDAARAEYEAKRDALDRFEKSGRDVAFFDSLNRFLGRTLAEARKPEAACFRQVLDYLALPAEEVAFIDDKPSNVDAARALGMPGIVATDAGQIAADLECLGVTLT